MRALDSRMQIARSMPLSGDGPFTTLPADANVKDTTTTNLSRNGRPRVSKGRQWIEHCRPPSARLRTFAMIALIGHAADLENFG